MTSGPRDKKRQILASATDVFARRGFVDATISDIAKGAGLGASGIYVYYKSKEEIFFTIIEDFLTRSARTLQEHLEGITGAENRLRKAIWYHCREYSRNKDVIQIVLESRSYPRFYRSSAYRALKAYATIVTDVIAGGIADGTFPGVTSPIPVRDMILGAVDHIAIDWSVQDIPPAAHQAETIVAMVLRAVRRSGKSDGPGAGKADKRRRLVELATACFSSKGFTDTSMLEIARQANVAEGTIYEYFGNKENLLISIPAEKLSGLYETISGRDTERRIRDIISTMFRFYSDEKPFSTILVLMLRVNRRFHRSESSRIIEDIFRVIEGLIRKGQQEGDFCADLDMAICRHLLFGTIDHVLIPWIIFKREYDLIKTGEAVADLYINALRK